MPYRCFTNNLTARFDICRKIQFINANPDSNTLIDVPLIRPIAHKILYYLIVLGNTCVTDLLQIKFSNNAFSW